MSDDEKLVVGEPDLMRASWAIAEMIYGPDDGTMERDDIECRMQVIMREVFSLGKELDERNAELRAARESGLEGEALAAVEARQRVALDNFRNYQVEPVQLVPVTAFDRIHLVIDN